MLRRIFLSTLLIIAIFMVGCSRVVPTPSSYALVSDRSIDGLDSGVYARLVETGNDMVFIRLMEGFDQAWQSTARAAELANLQISETNAQRGYFRLQPKKKEKERNGFVIRTSGILKHFESLMTSDQRNIGSVRIRLISLEDNSTKIVPVTEAGNWDKREIAVAILEQLHDAFSEDNNDTKKLVNLTNTQRPKTAVAASSGSTFTNLHQPTSNTPRVSSPATLQVNLVDLGSNRVYIHLHEGFEQAWFTTARGLKQASINISKSDSLNGIYTLGRRGMEDSGMKIRFFGVFKWFESLDLDDDEKLRLRLTDLGDNSSMIVPVDDKGEWDISDEAISIVNLLYRSIKQL